MKFMDRISREQNDENKIEVRVGNIFLKKGAENSCFMCEEFRIKVLRTRLFGCRGVRISPPFRCGALSAGGNTGQQSASSTESCPAMTEGMPISNLMFPTLRVHQPIREVDRQ